MAKLFQKRGKSNKKILQKDSFGACSKYRLTILQENVNSWDVGRGQGPERFFQYLTILTEPNI